MKMHILKNATYLKKKLQILFFLFLSDFFAFLRETDRKDIHSLSLSHKFQVRCHVSKIANDGALRRESFEGNVSAGMS